MTNSTLSRTSVADPPPKGDPIKVPKNAAHEEAMEIAATVVKNSIRKAVKEVDLKEKFPQQSGRLQRIAEPSMVSYVSLYNNYRNVLKAEKVLRIEEKMADIEKYSQVISDDLKILIVDRIRGINQQQVNLLQMKIMESLENYANSNPKQIPRFLEHAYAFKCLKIVCADEFTVNWLRKLIDNLSPPPWKGARLEVTLMSSYSISSTLSKQRTHKPKPNEGRIKFVIPKTDKKLEFAEIMKRFEQSNPPLNTGGWTKLKEHNTKTGTLYYVSMCINCIKSLKAKDNRLFYLLGRIDITILNENEIVECNDKIDTSPAKIANQQNLT